MVGPGQSPKVALLATISTRSTMSKPQNNLKMRRKGQRMKRRNESSCHQVQTLRALKHRQIRSKNRIQTT